MSYSVSHPDPNPRQKAARLANILGWSYIVTIVAIFFAPDTPPGPLRQCVVYFSVLFTIIGFIELFWRWQLVRTGEARWVKILALNEVGGTLALIWNVWLIYIIPDDVLLKYFKANITPSTWAMINHFNQTMGGFTTVNDALIQSRVHFSKMSVVYAIGPALLLSQFWIIYRYLVLAREIEEMPEPAEPASLPPVLK